MKNNSILSQSKVVNVLCSVVLERDNNYLMVRETKKQFAGLWNFPAGKVEMGENLIDAARREAKEESGYNCEITELVSVHYFYWDKMPGLSIKFNFLGKIISNEKSLISDDISETSWMSAKDIEHLATENKLKSKSTVKLLREIKNSTRYPLSVIDDLSQYSPDN